MSPKKAITVIGIGRVGLPLALFLAEKGYKVFGVGRSERKREKLSKGIMPFMERGAPTLLKKHIGVNFIPQTDYNSVFKSEIIILTLGTPIDENMDPVLDQIDEVLDSILNKLKKGQLIILRSTVSPKTTIYVKDIIEKSTKLKVGRDIYLAFCPERIAEGKTLEELPEIPQIIGGVDKMSSRKAADFFSTLKIPHFVTDSISAELAKLFTNMYRYISFAIANEFMLISENFHRNIYEIVDLVNRGYKRGGLAVPGFTGGPCLFKDGFFLIGENPYLDLITASWKINEAMPLFLISKVCERVKLKNKKVAILGLSFKPEIDDIRESLSFKLRKGLVREQAKIYLHDPFVKNYRWQKIEKDLNSAVDGADVVFIATRHKYYVRNKNLILKSIKKNAYICDVWNLFGLNRVIFQANQA